MVPPRRGGDCPLQGGIRSGNVLDLLIIRQLRIMCSILALVLVHLTTEKTAVAALREIALPMPSLMRERDGETVLSGSRKSQHEIKQPLRRPTDVFPRTCRSSLNRWSKEQGCNSSLQHEMNQKRKHAMVCYRTCTVLITN